MFKTANEWFTALKAWFAGTSGTASREAIEAQLDVNSIRAFFNVQAAHLNSSGKSRYGQVLRGGGVPSDRTAVIVPGLPAGLDYVVDEWEGPSGKGWVLRVYDVDGSHLRIDSDESSDWVWIDPPVTL